MRDQLPSSSALPVARQSPSSLSSRSSQEISIMPKDKRSTQRGRTKFQTSWMCIKEFKDWVVPGSSIYTAKCKYCFTELDISSMGRTALTSHAKGKKHEKHMGVASSQPGAGSYYGPSSSQQASDRSTVPPQAAVALATKTDNLKAETLWVLRTINSNNSFHENENITASFAKMFPDSAIAQNMSCGETKTMYVACHGIAPYFKKLVMGKIRDDSFVCMFDESLNAELQKKQNDYWIRHWDGNQVISSYFISDFMGHGAASNLLDNMEDCIGIVIGYRNMLSLSMDGPAVNWKL